MIDVEIKNFQAIDDLKLEIEGFTALVGRTNIGKSSIVRAIKTALSGGSGSDFVRHDARSCARILTGKKSCKCFSSVKVMFTEGNGFLWEKGAKSVNRYTVWKNGVESIFDRVGQSMELHEVLGAEFAPVKLGHAGSKSLLQVSSQFDAPFMLDLSGGTVADILSDIGQLDDINQAMTLVSKDRRAALATRKVREGDVKALGEKLETYAGLDAHLRAVQDARALGEGLTALSRRFETLDRLLAAVAAATQGLHKLRAALAYPVPEVKPARASFETVERLARYETAWNSHATVIARLGEALRPKLPEAEVLRATAARWQKLRTWEATVEERARAVDRLRLVVERHSVPAMSWDSVAALKRVSGWLGALAGLKVAFEKAVGVQKLVLPDPAPITALFRKVAETGTWSERLARLEQEIQRDEQSLKECTAEVERVAAEFDALGICPTCRQGIHPENVLACAAG